MDINILRYFYNGINVILLYSVEVILVIIINLSSKFGDVSILNVFVFVGKFFYYILEICVILVN